MPILVTNYLFPLRRAHCTYHTLHELILNGKLRMDSQMLCSKYVALAVLTRTYAPCSNEDWAPISSCDGCTHFTYSMKRPSHANAKLSARYSRCECECGRCVCVSVLFNLIWHTQWVMRMDDRAAILDVFRSAIMSLRALISCLLSWRARNHKIHYKLKS